MAREDLGGEGGGYLQIQGNCKALRWGTEEMDSLVKGLLCKHEDQRSDPQHTCKSREG